MESFDLSELIFKVGRLKDDEPCVLDKDKQLKEYTDCSNVPEPNMKMLAKVSVVIDAYME